MAKKKKNSADVQFKPALKMTTKFYFKNTFWILLLNFVYLTSFYSFFREWLLDYVSEYKFIHNYVDIVAFSISMGFLYMLKVLLYTITVDNMFKDIVNTLGLVLSQFFSRFFPVLATTFLVYMITFFFSLASVYAFGILGLVCFIYCMFAPSISAVRSRDDGTLSGKKVIMGASAIAKSFTFMKGNFIRMVIYNILVCGALLALIQIPFFSEYTNTHGIDILKYIAFDFAVIFNITSMMIIEKTQQKKDDEKSQRYNKKYHFKR